MNYWQVLGIGKTADSREIKRAYAARLKKTRPDEDPEGFQKLHAAYKWAVAQARSNTELSPAEEVTQKPVPEAFDSQTEHPVEPVKSNTTESDYSQPYNPHVNEYFKSQAEDDDQHNQEEHFETSPYQPPVDEYFRSEQAPDQQGYSYIHPEHLIEEHHEDDNETLESRHEFLQGEWDQMTELTDMACTNITTLNDMRSWKFLEGREALFDLEFKSEYSHYVFGKIIECLQEAKGNKTISSEVYSKLDLIFRWEDRRDYLESEFGCESVERVLVAGSGMGERSLMWIVPKVHKGRMEHASYYARMFAAFFDFLIFGFMLVLLAKAGHDFLGVEGESKIFVLIMGALVYVLIAPILEATPMQGTIGKVLFGMKVVNLKGKRLNIIHSLIRAWIFGMSTAAFKITVWINFFLGGERLLHDRISRSIVVKR